MSYDSKEDTLNHIAMVQYYIIKCKSELEVRIISHDQSKLNSPEKEIFDEFTPKLKDCQYGSIEYKKFLKEMQIGLEHHYKNNRHHPEYFENGIQGMNLIDLLEMLCDWTAATLRHKDGNIKQSIEINQKRFNYSDDLKQILLNTLDIIKD